MVKIFNVAEGMVTITKLKAEIVKIVNGKKVMVKISPGHVEVYPFGVFQTW